jgi:hypothetical protein
MSSAPAWVLLLVPIITALSTYAITKIELLSLRAVKEFEGPWHAYYIDPDTRNVETELWTVSGLGAVTVSRGKKTTFKGRLTLRGNKAYVAATSTLSRDERLFVMLDVPLNPRTGDHRPCPCIWLGKSGNNLTTAAHGILSRDPLQNPPLKSEFLLAC